jgi:hypothetical protein
MQVVRFPLAVVFALVLANLAPAVQDKEKPDEKPKQKIYEVGKDGLNIDAQLTDKDNQGGFRGDGFYSKIYLVKFAKGKTYQIDMASGNFDCYLGVRDEKNKLLVEDDDSGGGTNARIIFEATEDGVFRIVTTSFSAGENGAFNLKIQQQK